MFLSPDFVKEIGKDVHTKTKTVWKCKSYRDDNFRNLKLSERPLFEYYVGVRCYHCTKYYLFKKQNVDPNQKSN